MINPEEPVLPTQNFKKIDYFLGLRIEKPEVVSKQNLFNTIKNKQKLIGKASRLVGRYGMVPLLLYICTPKGKKVQGESGNA